MESRTQFSNLKNKSLIKPSIDKEGHIEVFQRMVLKDLQDLKIKKIYDPSDIKSGIKKLEERKKGMKKGLLNKNKGKNLQPLESRIPIIYTLPKIHKNKEKMPERPIVNGINLVGVRIGEYIDWSLQPIVRKTNSYLRDTKHLIQLLDNIKKSMIDRYILPQLMLHRFIQS